MLKNVNYFFNVDFSTAAQRSASSASTRARAAELATVLEGPDEGADRAEDELERARAESCGTARSRNCAEEHARSRINRVRRAPFAKLAGRKTVRGR